MVVICNQLVASGAAELKHKVGGKASGVALDLLIQVFSGHAVKGGEVGIDHDFLATEDEELPGDAGDDEECGCFSLR